MKKSLIALAVAGALTAPMVAQADATLYGSMRIQLQSLSGANELDVGDNASRIGIKGSHELFSGSKAIFQFEQGISIDGGSWGGGRLASAGATGDWGTVNFGRQWSPFALWTLFPTDIVDNATSGASGYATGMHRLGNTMAYITPAMSGFQAAAVLVASSDVSGSPGTVNTAIANNGEELDAYNLAAKYSTGGLTVAVSTIGVELVDKSINSAAVSYAQDAIYVAARYQQNELVANEDSYELAGSYTMGNTKLLANYIDDDNAADEKWSLEVQQKLSKQSRVFASYLDMGTDDGIEVGYRVDF